MKSNAFLLASMVIFSVAVYFNTYHLPGTIELTVLSVPVFATLLFRYLRLHYKSERNVFLRFFFFIMLMLSTLIIFMTILGLSNIYPIDSIFLINISWLTLLSLHIVYYAYSFKRAHHPKDKRLYFILAVVGLLLFSGFILPLNGATQWPVILRLATMLTLLCVSVCILPFYKKFKVVNHRLAGVILTGNVFVNFLNVFSILT